MTLNFTRALWAWAGGLALTLLVLVPMGPVLRAVLTLGVLVTVATAWVVSGRNAARLAAAVGLASEMVLPPPGYRLPVVLVCGDGQRGLFSGASADQPAPHITAQACYILVVEIEQLPLMVKGLLALRPDWAAQLCVMFVVNLGEHGDAPGLAVRVRGFFDQIAAARRRGVDLPLLQISYVPAARGAGPWFSWEEGGTAPRVRDGATNCSLADWQREPSSTAEQATRLQVSVQVNSAGDWLQQHHRWVGAHAQPGRQAPGLAMAHAMTLVPPSSEHSPGNLWQQWLRDRAGLLGGHLPAADGLGPLPFPDALVPLLPINPRHTQRQRATVIAGWLLALAVLVALLSSAWQNTLLVRQVTDDLRRYDIATRPSVHRQPEFAQQAQALQTLQDDATRLHHHYRHGVPWALGLGLYRGEPLRLRVQAMLDHQPALPMAPASPALVRLDSLALFSSGSAQLKPGSTKVLVNALVGIKAQSGWLILISGHTDAIGTPEHNLPLSRARAAAVRDWMQRMGDIPASCFAVQGFGADQPVASNDTEAGRAANRRVDIRLVPEAGACALFAAEPGRQPQSHSATSNL